MSDDRKYVYGIAHPHGYVKIGYSKDPCERLKDHQVSTPYELWILIQLPVEDAEAVERQLHELLGDKNTRGEWFELGYRDYDMLADMMKMAASSYEFESVDDFRQWQARKQEAVL